VKKCAELKKLKKFLAESLGGSGEKVDFMEVFGCGAKTEAFQDDHADVVSVEVDLVESYGEKQAQISALEAEVGKISAQLTDEMAISTQTI
jgi:chromosome segregation ATPase